MTLPFLKYLFLTPNPSIKTSAFKFYKLSVDLSFRLLSTYIFRPQVPSLRSISVYKLLVVVVFL